MGGHVDRLRRHFDQQAATSRLSTKPTGDLSAARPEAAHGQASPARSKVSEHARLEAGQALLRDIIEAKGDADLRALVAKLASTGELDDQMQHLVFFLRALAPGLGHGGSLLIHDREEKLNRFFDAVAARTDLVGRWREGPGVDGGPIGPSSLRGDQVQVATLPSPGLPPEAGGLPGMLVLWPNFSDLEGDLAPPLAEAPRDGTPSPLPARVATRVKHLDAVLRDAHKCARNGCPHAAPPARPIPRDSKAAKDLEGDLGGRPRDTGGLQETMAWAERLKATVGTRICARVGAASGEVVNEARRHQLADLRRHPTRMPDVDIESAVSLGRQGILQLLRQPASF